MVQAFYRATGDRIDYTPGSDVAAGVVVVQGRIVGVVANAIDANRVGSLQVNGIVDAAKVAEDITVGNELYWDEDGDPVGGTAGTGAATIDGTKGVMMGYAAIAAASADTTVRTLLGRTHADDTT